MYRSLLFQLLEGVPGPEGIFDSLRLTMWPRDGRMEWTVELVKDLFGQAIQLLGRSYVVYFIDALDECDEDQIRDMVSFFEHIGELAMASNIRFQVCFSADTILTLPSVTEERWSWRARKATIKSLPNYVDSELKIGRRKSHGGDLS
ncbi:hypothetical protein MRS44_017490 [Fusarium solani]|uniref:uncharacterized protein n=1 Tax=Fusarium solani TaxID=169388 RepID=UPI0032C495F6|nr:hypothetical protein MRS44_017490 [Fusarium solani]